MYSPPGHVQILTVYSFPSLLCAGFPCVFLPLLDLYILSLCIPLLDLFRLPLCIPVFDFCRLSLGIPVLDLCRLSRKLPFQGCADVPSLTYAGICFMFPPELAGNRQFSSLYVIHRLLKHRP